MLAVSTNIYDFTNWLKYEIKHISKDFIIDISDVNQNISKLLNKIGEFEEDFEIFFCVLNPEVLNQQTDILEVSTYNIIEIKPLHNNIVHILSQKLGNFVLGDAIDTNLYQKIRKERIRQNCFNGLYRISRTFNLQLAENQSSFVEPFYNAIENNILNTSYEKDTLFDYLVTYERTKPYPINDIGFIYDTGAVYREWCHISDNDLQNREQLKNDDNAKYEMISYILEISKYLKNETRPEAPFSNFILYYTNSDVLKQFSNSLKITNDNDINYILLFSLFLKIRYLLRNSNDLTDETFINQIKNIISRVPKEGQISIAMCGLLFGSIKFKELAYKIKPLNISIQKTIEIRKPVLEKTKTLKETEPRKNDIVPTGNFDDTIFFQINSVLSPLSKYIVTQIEKTYNYVLNYKGDEKMNKINYFLNCLYKSAKEDEKSKKKNKLTIETVDKIKKILVID